MNSGLFGLARAAFVGALQGLALPVPTANGFLKWNGTASGWELVPYGTAANTVAAGDDSRLADTGVTPGTYGDATNVGQFTVGADGRITAAAPVAIGGGGGPDPTTSLDEIEDFISGNGTSGQIGKWGWIWAHGTFARPAPEVGHPGIVQLNTDVVGGTVVSLQPRLDPSFAIVAPDDLWDVTMGIRNFGDVTDTTIRFGFCNNAGGDPPSQGAYVERLPDSNAHWFGVTMQLGTSTRTSLAAIDDSNTFHRFRVRRIDPSSIGFTYDGGTEVVNTTNLPNANLTLFVQIISTLGNSWTVDVDYAWLVITGLSR